MSKRSLKSETLHGLSWNALENFSQLGIQFIFGIIMARLLSPTEYGIIGLTFVFLDISTVLVISGFSAALIRKPDRSEADLYTVFYFNIVVSILLYLILFICAPFVAEFYKIESLTLILRVIGLNIIIGAFSVVQNAILSIKIDFKTSANATLISSLASGILGITLAYNGFGVWSLVFQAITSCLLKTLLLWIQTKWHPLFVFSWNSFKELFSFGSKLLVSNILNTVYSNIYPIIIGKFFSTADLGIYSRANQYAQLPSSNLSNVIQRVTFPVLSKIQGDESMLISTYKKLQNMSSFAIFPCMMLLFGVADPLIRWMITDKWESCIVLLQVLCFSMMWYPVHALNLNLLQVKGRSDLFLKLEIIKKIIGVIIIIVFYRWGIIGLCYGSIVSCLVSLFINTYYTGKLFAYGFKDQIKDLFPILIYSIIAGISAFFSSKINIESNFLRLLISSSMFFFVFILFCSLFKNKEYMEVKSFVVEKIKNLRIKN